MRLIDANEIIKDEHQHYEYISDTFYVTVADIEEAPTIDAVQVVRCKYCEWGRTVSGCGEYVWCGKPYAPPFSSHIANWYCADGIRKEDVNND